MRAQFFLLDGESNASSGLRVMQYLPHLRAAGIESRVSRPVPEPLYQRWMEHGQRKAAFYGLFLATRLLDVLRSGDADVAVIQRDLFPFGSPLLERLLFRQQARVVYDTDDATYLRPSFTPDTVFQKLRRFDKVAEVVARARWVSVATEPIAAWARRFTTNVSVVPMALDLPTYDRVSRPAANRDLVIGWAGTAGGVRYLEALAPVLRRLAARHSIVLRVVTGVRTRVNLADVPLEVRPWSPESVLQEIKSFDIGLLPLADTEFEAAKFPLKLLQYLALRVPSVSARVGLPATVISDGENGLLASTPEEWFDALDRLIGDAALRTRIGDAGYATVAASYTTERVAPLLVDGLSRAAR